MNILIKNCKICGKEFTNQQYPKWFYHRKYCSPECSMKGFIRVQNECKIRDSIRNNPTMWTNPHGERLIKINDLINGKLIGAKTIAGTYEPDIMKDETELELQRVPAGCLRNYLKKFRKPRFDGIQPKDRILILSFPEDIIKYFNKILILESPKFEEDLKKIFNIS